jgi:hypothetical protein
MTPARKYLRLVDPVAAAAVKRVQKYSAIPASRPGAERETVLTLGLWHGRLEPALEWSRPLRILLRECFSLMLDNGGGDTH